MQKNHQILPGLSCDGRQLRGSTEPEGALVSAVEPWSAAAKAGLHAGDVIVEINNRAVRNPEEAASAVRSVKDGTVLVRVWRNGRKRYLLVVCDRMENPLRGGMTGMTNRQADG